MAAPTHPSDQARFVRPRFLSGVELVSARYRRRRFPVHSHGEYVVGAIVAGAQTLTTSGTDHIAARGSVLLLSPDQPHANASIGDDMLAYHVLYLPAALLESVAGEGLKRPRFAAPVLAAPALFRLVVETHATLGAASGRLEQETALARLAGALFGVADEAAGNPGGDDRIKRTRAFIDARYASGLSLADLSAVAGLSPFHMLRRFRAEVGLTPLAYRNQRRVLAARRLLREGLPVAAIAHEVGFADQSHLTRQFQRIMGVSPARYRQQ